MKYFDFSIRIIVWIFVLTFIPRFCKKQTDTFTILGISSNRPYSAEFATRPLDDEEETELQIALSQAYNYFGRGGQAYTFFSADGKYVIKFFKQRLFRPSWLLNHLPLPAFLHKFREKRNFKRADKLQRDFFSYKIAFEELHEETGLIYSHLNPTSHLKTKLAIKDRLGIRHFIDLDRFDFVVQKRATRVYDQIDELMGSGKVEEAKQALKEVFVMIQTRAKKGFRDRDPNIRTNCGFIGSRAIKIDVGRFVRSEDMRKKEIYSADLKRITAPFEEWIKETHPILLPSYRKTKEGFL
ncbi:MAG: hypothetical protein K1000chlam3_00571 [Chlamydiae bacterium]|nr:hypothetical protein [Chlamydiota bacterium]